jgi:hypothetical protein
MFDMFHGHLKIGAQSFKKDLHKFNFFYRSNSVDHLMCTQQFKRGL